MDNVILIGMPATGKSTVGVLLAKHLGFGFIDTDLLICAAARLTLREIISREGYQGFLSIEDEIGRKLSCSRTVVATGGSMVLSPAAMENLHRLGTVVWLDTPLEQLSSRLSGNLEERGVATATKMTVEEIYAQRAPLYRHYADKSLLCSGDAQTVAGQLAVLLA